MSDHAQTLPNHRPAGGHVESSSSTKDHDAFRTAPGLYALSPSVIQTEDLRATDPGMVWSDDDDCDDEEVGLTTQPMARGQLDRLVDTYLFEEAIDDSPEPDVVFSCLEQVSGEHARVSLPSPPAMGAAYMTATKPLPQHPSRWSNPLVLLAIVAPLCIALGWVLGRLMAH